MAFWLMLVATIAAVAVLICVALVMDKDDERTNDWLDDMCASHGGAYCQHKLPTETQMPAH